MRQANDKGEATLKLKPGDIVRVVGSRGTAKVRATLSNLNGALLEEQIDGLRPACHPSESS